MPSSWREEYLSALKERSEIEKGDQPLIDAYTRLADRLSSVEASKNASTPPITPAAITSPTSKPGTPTPTSSSAAASQLKVDLAEALRSKGQFQSRLKAAEEELEKLRAKTKSDGRRIDEVTTERNALVVRVRDRDEELRGKAKLIENVQDEMVSLNLQLNMSEQQKKKLQKENKELVDRWMARMGKEADAMNDASRFS